MAIGQGRGVGTGVVIGAGGMGREAAAWFAAAGGTVLGFLDDDAAAVGQEVGGRRVLGQPDWLLANDVDEVIIGAGSPRARRSIHRRLTALGLEPATVVHPSATIGPRVTVGRGTIVCPSVVLTCDITIGVAGLLNYGAAIGHDADLGDFVVVAPGVAVAGKVTVGAGAELGIGASVIQRLTLGSGTIVGAGAVVHRDVPPNVTVVGVPASITKEHDVGW